MTLPHADETSTLLIIDAMDDAFIAQLKEQFGERLIYAPSMTAETLVGGNYLPTAGMILTRSTSLKNPAIYDQAPQLKAVMRAGSGTDNINLSKATSNNVAVLTALGANKTAVAEHAFAELCVLLKRQGRKLPTLMQQVIAARGIETTDAILKRDALPEHDHGIFNHFKNRTSSETLFDAEGQLTEDAKAALQNLLKEKTIFIDGITGHTGGAMAVLAKAAGATVLGVRSHHPEKGAINQQLTQAGMEILRHREDALARADIISLHLPLTDATKHLYAAEKFAVIKKGALIINNGRGDVVDAKALIATIQTGHIKGYAVDDELDVLHKLAPLIQDHCKNLVLSPHNAAKTLEAMAQVARYSKQAVQTIFTGELVENPLYTVIHSGIGTKNPAATR